MLIFEDPHLLAVNKPHGMPAQPDPSGDPSVLDHFPGTWLIHRLDRPASGLMILAKTPVAAKNLSRAFQERKVEKLYLVLIQGLIDPPAQEVTHHLVHDARHNRSRAYLQPKPRSKLATLRYRTIQENLLEVELFTGRHHQIRAQFQLLGHPLIGDAKYGAKRNEEAIALHSWRLTLPGYDTLEAPLSPFMERRTQGKPIA